MSETYQSKRERWQSMLESLPIDLRDHVSLRNKEAVASLTSQAQERLVEALQSGLKRLPRAVEQFRMNPETSMRIYPTLYRGIINNLIIHTKRTGGATSTLLPLYAAYFSGNLSRCK
jgi:hypothetical protein